MLSEKYKLVANWTGVTGTSLQVLQAVLPSLLQDIPFAHVSGTGRVVGCGCLVRLPSRLTDRSIAKYLTAAVPATCFAQTSEPRGMLC